jgi:hypothetical protein
VCVRGRGAKARGAEGKRRDWSADSASGCQRLIGCAANLPWGPSPKTSPRTSMAACQRRAKAKSSWEARTVQRSALKKRECQGRSRRNGDLAGARLGRQFRVCVWISGGDSAHFGPVQSDAHRRCKKGEKTRSATDRTERADRSVFIPPSLLRAVTLTEPMAEPWQSLGTCLACAWQALGSLGYACQGLAKNAKRGCQGLAKHVLLANRRQLWGCRWAAVGIRGYPDAVRRTLFPLFLVL